MKIEIEVEDWHTANRESREFQKALSAKLMSQYDNAHGKIETLSEAIVHLAQILAEHNLLDPQIFYDSL